MITNSHPEGRKAAQSLMDGMLIAALDKGIAPEVVISASLSMLVWMAEQADEESRKAIAQAMRAALACIEDNQAPTEGTVLATSGALH
jgi:hypothetical protein